MELRLCLLFAIVALASAAPRSHQQPQPHQRYITPTPTTQSDLKDALNKLCPLVQHDLKVDSPAQFGHLVSLLRESPQEVLTSVHTDIQKGSFCSGSNKLVDLWNDALIMDASPAALSLVTRQIVDKQFSQIRSDYLTTMMAFAPRPTAASVEAVLPILQQQDVSRQGLLGVSSLIRNYLKDGRLNQQVKVATKSIVDYMKRNIKSQEKVIVALKALSNIEQIDEVAQDILRMAESRSEARHGVRVAAIECLKRLAGNKQVRDAIMSIYQNTDESAEIRIAAYRVVIEGADRDVVQKVITVLKREDNKQVRSYVSSHLKNIKESSSPRLQSVHDILEQFVIPAPRFPQSISKYSQNFELSHHVDQLGFGGVFDADLVYDRSVFPRSVRVNLTVPVYEQEVNLFEVGFRQVGLEDQLRDLVGPNGQFNVKDINELIQSLKRIFSEEGALKKLARKDVEGSLYLAVAGKTVAYVDVADLMSFNGESDLMRLVDTIIESARKSDYKMDRALSLMFLNQQFEIPQGEDKVPVSLNGTIIVSLKADKNVFWPSVAFELSTRTANRRFVQRIASSPAISFKVEGDNKITFNLPQERVNLLHVDTRGFEIDEQGREVESNVPVRRHEQCWTQGQAITGLQVCGKVQYPEHIKESFIPFKGVWNLQLELVKADAPKGWEFIVDLPNNYEGVYKFSFNTPSSKQDRLVALDVQYYNQLQGVRANFKCPSKTVAITSEYTFTEGKEINGKAQITIDNKDKYIYEMGLSKKQEGKKVTYVPIFKVATPNRKDIALTGFLALTQGAKAQISFELKDIKDNRSYLKGSIAKSFTSFKSFNMSADVAVDVKNTNVQVHSQVECNDGSLSKDLQITYQLPKSQKHHIKVTAKYHNLSDNKQTKVNSFVEVEMTQFPQRNFHLNWNVLNKPEVHVENEMTLMWSHDMRDVTKKIHLLQVSKMNGIRSGLQAECDNTILVEIAPLNIKYEVKAIGNMERSQTPKYKGVFEVNNLNKKEQPIRSVINVQTQSVKPLKMTIDASIQTPVTGPIRYSDKLEEISDKTYQGRTQLEWGNKKSFNLDYTLKDRSDSRAQLYELDTEVKTSTMSHPVHHQGSLRFHDALLEVTSKLTHQKPLYEASLKLDREGKSAIIISSQGSNGKIEVTPNGPAKAFLVQFSAFNTQHITECKVDQNQVVSLASKTERDGKKVLTFNGRHESLLNGQFNIDAPKFDGRFECNTKSQPRVISFDLKQKAGDRWNLRSTTSYKGLGDVEASIEGKSNKVSPFTGQLKVKSGKNDITFELDSFRDQKQYVHAKTTLASRSSSFVQNSQVSKEGSDLFKSDLKFDRNIFSGPHDIEVVLSGSESVKIHHEMSNGDLSVKMTHQKNGQVESNVEVTGRGKITRKQAEFVVSVESRCNKGIKGIKSVQVALSHKHNNQERERGDSNTFIQCNVNQGKPYQIKVLTERQPGQIRVTSEVQTPHPNYENQSGEGKVFWSEKEVKANLKGVNSRKEAFEMTLTGSRSNQRFNLDGDLKFNGESSRVTLEGSRPEPHRTELKGELTHRNQVTKGFLQSSLKLEDMQVKGEWTRPNQKPVRVELQGSIRNKGQECELKGQFNGDKVIKGRVQSIRRPGKVQLNGDVTVDNKSGQLVASGTYDDKRMAVEADFSSDWRNLPSISFKTEADPEFINVQGKYNERPVISIRGKSQLNDPKKKIASIEGKVLSSPLYKVESEVKSTGKLITFTLNGHRDGQQVFSAKCVNDHQNKDFQGEAIMHQRDARVSYNVRSNGKNFYQVDATIKTPAMKQGWKQDASLQWNSNSQVMELKSTLAKEGRQILKVDSSLNRKTRSFVTIESDVINGQFQLDRSAKSGSLDITTSRIHQECKLNWAHGVEFESNTQRDNKNICHLKITHNDEKGVKITLNSSLVDGHFDASQKGGAFDFTQKFGDRAEFKGKTSVNGWNSIESSLEGKTQRIAPHTINLMFNSHKEKTQFHLSSARNGNEWYKLESDYGRKAGHVFHHLMVSQQERHLFKSDFNIEDSFLAGPHELQVEFPNREIYQIKHEITNGNIECSIVREEQGKETGRIQLQGKGKVTLESGELAYRFHYNCKHHNYDLQANLRAQHKMERGIISSLCNMGLNVNQKQQGLLTLSFDKKQGKATFSMDSESKIRGYESQKGDITLEWNKDKRSISAQYTDSEKTPIQCSLILLSTQQTFDLKGEYGVHQQFTRCTVRGQMDENKGEGELKVELNHRGDITKGSVSASVQPDTVQLKMEGTRREKTTRAEVKAQLRNNECEIRCTFNGRHNLEVRINGSSTDTQTKGSIVFTQDNKSARAVAAISLAGDRVQVDASTTSDFKSLPVISFKGEGDRNWAKMEAKYNGQEVARLQGKVIVSSPLPPKYVASFEGKIMDSPLYKVDSEGKSAGNTMSYTLNGQKDGQRMISAKVDNDFQKKQFSGEVATQDGQVRASYIVRITGKNSYQVQGNLKTPSMKQGLKPEGSLRWARDQVELKGTVHHEGNKVVDITSNLNRRERSFVNLQSNWVNGKLNFDRNNKRCELTASSSQFQHESKLNWNQYLNIESTTQRNNQQVAVVKVTVNPEKTMCMVKSDFVDISYEGDRKEASFSLNQKMGQKVNLKCQVTYQGVYGVKVDMKSAKMAQYSGDLKVKPSRTQVIINLVSKKNNKDYIVGDHTLIIRPDSYVQSAQLQKEGRVLFQSEAKVNRNALLNGPHTFHVEIGSHLIKGEHTYVDGQMNCRLSHFENKKKMGHLALKVTPKFLSVKQGEGSLELDGQCVHGVWGVKSLQVTLQHQHSLNNGYQLKGDSTFKVIINGKEPFEVKILPRK